MEVGGKLAGMEGSLREVVERQMELLQNAMALNQVIFERLKLEEDQTRGAGIASARGSCPMHAALVSALVPLQRNSYLAPDGSAGRGSLDEPLLPPCEPDAERTGPHTPLRKSLTAAEAPKDKAQTRWSRSVSDEPSPHGEKQARRGSKDGTKAAEPRRPLFPTAADVKARVLEALQTPEYRVEDFYKDTGFCQAVASSRWFQNLTLIVIALNTVWIAVETDYNKAPILVQADRIFQVVDNLFCAYFTFEILTRFFAFRRKVHAFGDGWFVFDATLVLLMVCETWIFVALYVTFGSSGGGLVAGHTSVFRILRIFRLTRVARMARLLRGMPQLMILVKGMFEGIRSVSATLILLVLIIYVFAVMFTQLLSGTEVGAGCFDSVPEAMNCLLLEGVFTEQAEFIRKLLDADWKYYFFMLVYLLFVSLTVMNMLIAVLCEVVSVVAQVDKDEQSMKELRFKVTNLMQNLGVANGEHFVSKDHFSKLTEEREAMRSLHEVGVDVVALVELGDFLFRDADFIPLNDFIQVVLQFRGSNTATVKDVVDMRKFVSRELADLEARLLKQKA